MKLLAVNCGSSTLKFQLYEMPEETVIMKGNFERIGLDDSHYSIKIGAEKIKKEATLKNHGDAVLVLVEELLSNNVIESLDDIKAVGHRVVHGGKKYGSSVVITEEVLNDIEEIKDLAPLHNPAGIMGIRAFTDNIPNAIQVACFDTAFHQTMSKENYLYSVPYEWFSKFDIRKYGFHGMSHKYISLKMEEVLGTKNSNLIICHIGSGASISAVRNGQCVDTTMGFTPNAGIMMGTRSGDIDYTMIGYLMNKAGLSYEEIDNKLNKLSGLQGICDMSDLRDIDEAYEMGEEKAVLAVDMYTRRIADYIAKYYLHLDGKVDAICFTAGVGENDPIIRREVLNRLKALGVEVNNQVNDNLMVRKGIEGCITTDSSSIPAYVYGTDEELMIVRDAYQLTNE